MYPKVEVIRVDAPQISLGERKYYTAVRGPLLTSWTVFQANSRSNSSISVTCNPPTRSQIVSRRVLLSVQFTATFAGTGNPLLQLGVNDGLRAYPLACVISSQTMDVANTKTQSQSLNQYMPAILRYSNDFDSQNRNYSMTPSMFDTYQEYGQWALYGSAKNPLALDGENSVQATRGGFPYVSVTNGNGSAVVVVQVTEPLWMSPFIFEKHSSPGGFTNVENMSYTATFGNLSQIWSHALGGNTISSLIVNLDTAALFFESYAPDPTIPIPKSLSYSYYNIVPYISTQGFSVAPGASATLVSQNIQLSGIPKRIYLYAQQQFGDRSFTSTDTFFQISQVTVLWNTANYLSSAPPQNLYQIAVKNGIELSWNEWFAETGGILALNFGDDIALQPGEAPGSMGKNNLYVTMNVTNLHPSLTVTPSLYMVAVYEGQMSIIEGTIILNQSMLTPRDVLEAVAVPGISYCSSSSVYGGNFLSDAFRGIKGVANKVLSSPLTAGLLAGLAGQAVGVPAPIAAALAQGALSQGAEERRAERDEKAAVRSYEHALALERLKQEAKNKPKGSGARGRPAHRPRMRGAGFGEAAEIVQALAAEPPDPLARYLQRSS